MVEKTTKERRKPLTRKVRRGLRSLTGYAEAGAPSDIGIGSHNGTMNAEERKAWDDIQAAIDWVSSLPE